MPGATVDISTGAAITFSSGFFAEVLNIDWSGISRESIDTTHFGTTQASAGEFGSRTFIPGDLSDPGELSVEMHFNPDDDVPIESVAETVTLTFDLVAGDTTPANWEGTGFMTSFDVGMPLEDKMTATAVIKFSGNITMTDAA